MIDDKIVLEFLEFIAAKTDKRKDYAELFERVPDFNLYLRYLKEEGLIAHDGSFSSGSPRQHVTTIKGEFHHFKQYANMQLTSKGINYLKEKKMSTIEKVKEEYRKQGVSWFVTASFSIISFFAGYLWSWFF